MLRHAQAYAAASLVFFLALATLFAGLAFRESSRVLTELRSHTDRITHTLEAAMAPDFSTPATDGVTGELTTVNTTCGQGNDPNGEDVPADESFDDCLDRHRRKVAAVKRSE